MADYKKISDFSEASAFEDTDKLLVDKLGVTLTILGSKIKAYCQAAISALVAQADTDASSAAASKTAAQNAQTAAESAKTAATQQATNATNANTAAQQAKADAQAAATAMQECAAYSSTKAYAVGNMATYNGSTYRCTTACTGIVPTNTSNWLLIAAAGKDGAGTGDMLASVYDPAGGAKQVAFSDHTHTAAQVGADVSGAAATVQTNLNTHTASTANPHSVTKSQVGLGSVENKALSTVINRTTNVNAADANYTTLMARGMILMDAATYDAVTDWTTVLVNGAIALRYE